MQQRFRLWNVFLCNPPASLAALHNCTSLQADNLWENLPPNFTISQGQGEPGTTVRDLCCSFRVKTSLKEKSYRLLESADSENRPATIHPEWFLALTQCKEGAGGVLKTHPPLFRSAGDCSCPPLHRWTDFFFASAKIDISHTWILGVSGFNGVWSERILPSEGTVRQLWGHLQPFPRARALGELRWKNCRCKNDIFWHHLKAAGVNIRQQPCGHVEVWHVTWRHESSTRLDYPGALGPLTQLDDSFTPRRTPLMRTHTTVIYSTPTTCDSRQHGAHLRLRGTIVSSDAMNSGSDHLNACMLMCWCDINMSVPFKIKAYYLTRLAGEISVLTFHCCVAQEPPEGCRGQQGGYKRLHFHCWPQGAFQRAPVSAPL